MGMKQLPADIAVHPAATLFPMMDEATFNAFKADIAAHGQRESVLYFHGQVLDGRNRLLACLELGLEPLTAEFDEDSGLDPYEYVISHNLHRRHLTETQRAMIAARMANLQNGSNQHRSAEGVSKDTPRSLDDAAKLLNVSRPSVCRAKKVLDQGATPLVEAVERGEVSVSLAAKLIDAEPNKKQQAKLAAQGKKAIREWIVPSDEVESDADDDAAVVRQDHSDADAIEAFANATNRLVVLKAILKSLAAHELVWLRETIEETE